MLILQNLYIIIFNIIIAITVTENYDLSNKIKYLGSVAYKDK